MSRFKLFLVFAKIGAILLGGGYVILPIVTEEFVKKRKLISQEDIIDFFALSQSLPGIIAANISMFIGYKLHGKFGALTAMFGIIFVPFWTIVLLASVLDILVNNNYIQGALWGVGVAVIVLIIMTIREMWQKSKKDTFFYTIFFSTLFALIVFKLSPVQAILIFTIIGIIYKKLVERKQ